MPFIVDRINSFKNAFRGVFVFFHTYGGWHAKIHFAASIIAIYAGFRLSIPSQDWLWVSLAICMVWITEIINTCIELIVDIIHPQRGESARVIKDMAAGAVVIAAIFSMVVAFLIFIYPFFF